MIYESVEETMDSLIGRYIVDYGREDSLLHVTLDDGRTLIFVGMGILVEPDVLH